MNHVLIVDDEAEIRESLEAILREEDYLVTTAATAAEALVLLRDADYDVVLLDIWLPDGDGLDTLGEIRQHGAAPMLPKSSSSAATAPSKPAVRATKLGAYDFLEKPLSLDRTLIVLKNAMKARQMREDNQEFVAPARRAEHVTGRPVPMKALRQQIKLMAPTNGRVLIYGESGTGKELIGRAMHAESLRNDRVFVELNCAAIPEDYIETELFGYRHGAVRRAAHRKARHLRARRRRHPLPRRSRRHEPEDPGQSPARARRAALSTRRRHRTPSTSTSASSPPPTKTSKKRSPAATSAKTSSTASTSSPSTSRRCATAKKTSLSSSKNSSTSSAQQYGRPHVEMTDDALDALRQYHWPGNVRELRNLVERVLILNPKAQRIERKHLPMLVYRDRSSRSQARINSKSEEFSTLVEAREAYERDYILKKLDEFHGNVSRAAEGLGPRTHSPLPQDESPRRQRQRVANTIRLSADHDGRERNRGRSRMCSCCSASI